MARTYTNTPEPRYVEKAKETESIPQVSSDDNGKYLGVVDGKIQTVDLPIPQVSTDDNGKYLGVVNGKIQTVVLPKAEAVEDADADDVVQTVNAVISALVTAGLMEEYVPPMPQTVVISFKAFDQGAHQLLPLSYTRSYDIGYHIPSADVAEYVNTVLEQNRGTALIGWNDDPTNYEVTEEMEFVATFSISQPG